jgi:CRISPR/Cas system-associated exonuclease Cas4 (RecB family)
MPRKLHYSMRKIFNHFLIEKINLIQEENSEGRFYISPSGKKLPSVTTVLDKHSDKSWLVEWKRRVGPEVVERITSEALKKGNAVHALAEKYILNEKNYIEDITEIYLDDFNPIKKTLDKYVNNVYGSEVPLFSTALKTAGRADLVAEFDGALSIIDFKTSSRPKTEKQIENYFLQATVYSMMFERMYEASVTKIAIIMTVKDEWQPLLFIKDRNKYIKRVLEIFT